MDVLVPGGGRGPSGRSQHGVAGGEWGETADREERRGVGAATDGRHQRRRPAPPGGAPPSSTASQSFVGRVRVLSTWWERLRGLLGTDADAPPVLLANCASIHTFGMRYAIDVAFVARDGTVLAAYGNVPPGRLLARRGARFVLERPHLPTCWPRAGDRLGMTLVADVRSRARHE